MDAWSMGLIRQNLNACNSPMAPTLRRSLSHVQESLALEGKSVQYRCLLFVRCYNSGHDKESGNPEKV
jgi:hypothetical protein